MFLISFIGDNNKTIRELAAIMNILMMRDLRCIILIDPWNFQESPFQKSREGRPKWWFVDRFWDAGYKFQF